MDEEKTSFFQNRVFQVSAIVVCILVLTSFIGLLYFMISKNSANNQPEKVEKEIDNLKVGVSDDYTDQDIGPTKNYDQNSYIFKNVYDSLVSYSDDGKLTPDLATSWTNPNDTTWRFILRKDVKFSDGKDFTADDVRYTFDTIRADNESQLSDYFSEITAVNVLASDEVEITTASPAPYLISKLSFLFIVPNGSKNITLASTPGTGPFTYNKQETISGKQLVLDRSKSYWGDKPKVGKVTISIYSEDEKQKVEDFQQGKIQIIDAHLTESVEAMAGATNVKNLFVNENSVFYLILNNNEEAQKYISVSPNPLKDKRVRLAMWEALDTNGLINETMKGVAVPADQIVARQTFGFNPSIKRPEYNLDDAKKLMAENGNEKGFKLKLLIGESRKDVGEYIKKSWAKIGIDVELELQQETNYLDKFMAHDFGVGAISWSEDSMDGQNTLLTLFSDNDQNMGSFKDEPLVKVMTDLSGETNQRNRQKLIQEGFKIIRDEVPVIPLYSKKINWFTAGDIGWQPPATLDVYFKNAKRITEVQAEPKKSGFFSRLKFW